MKLSGVNESAWTLDMNAEGETKTVTMLTDTSAVPYSGYFSMPSGYVPWLNIVVSANMFYITVQNNLFAEEDRSVVVRFHCLPTQSGSWQEQNVTITQSKDTVELVFTPASVSLNYLEGSYDEVAVSGIPTGATIDIIAPSWLVTELTSESQLKITASGNPNDTERDGTVRLIVNDRAFFFPVIQEANTADLTFSIEDIEEDYLGGTTTVTVTGIPVGATPVIATSGNWIVATLLSDTLTVLVKEQKDFVSRTGSVTLSVGGREFAIVVRQAKSPFINGKLTLDSLSYTAVFNGASIVVTASEMPTDAEQLTCTVDIVGQCQACSINNSFIRPVTLAYNKIRLDILPQNILEGVQRTATVNFVAGGISYPYQVTQEAPPTVYRLKGNGDKFIKTVNSLVLPTALAEVTASELYEDIKKQEWERLIYLTSSNLVGANFDKVALSPAQYDAYKTSYSRSTVEGVTTQKIVMGATAYRFRFIPDAIGQMLRGLSFYVRTDGYCIGGLRVALEVGESSSPAPSTSWDTSREGTSQFFYKNVGMRTKNPADGLFYGATYNIGYDEIDVESTSNTYVILYVTIEDYKGVVNGWAYGSGIVVPEFNFYTEELIGGIDADSTITELEVVVSASAMPISIDKFVANPRIPSQNVCTVRELLYSELSVGSSNVHPTDDMAFASIPALFAAVATNGMRQVDMTAHPYTPWNEKQNGLIASIGRHIGGVTSPYANTLRYLVSPLLIQFAVPNDSSFKRLRIIHSEGEPQIDIQGALVALSLYWFSNQNVNFDNFSAVANLPGLMTGPLTLSAGSLSGKLAGEMTLPASIAPGTSLSITLREVPKGWGTMLILPRILRVTVEEFPLKTVLGLSGVTLDDDRVVGNGWFPNLKMEV